jgi:hypothetical protein
MNPWRGIGQGMINDHMSQIPMPILGGGILVYWVFRLLHCDGSANTRIDGPLHTSFTPMLV